MASFYQPATATFHPFLCSVEYRSMNNVTLIGICASLCTALASIPQLVKVIQCKKADDISPVMLIVLIAGLALWVWYGVFKNDFILIVANSIPFLVNAMLLFFYFRYKKT
jgi:MtN3 and saliva related transmembrane protein